MERARIRLGSVGSRVAEETAREGWKKGSTPRARARAPFRELISHERAKAGRTSAARYAILLNYDSPRCGGTNVSCGRVPTIFLSP